MANNETNIYNDMFANQVQPTGPLSHAPWDRCYYLRNVYECSHTVPPTDDGDLIRVDDCVMCFVSRHSGHGSVCMSPPRVDRRRYSECPKCVAEADTEPASAAAAALDDQLRRDADNAQAEFSERVAQLEQQAADEDQIMQAAMALVEFSQESILHDDGVDDDKNQTVTDPGLEPTNDDSDDDGRKTVTPANISRVRAPGAPAIPGQGSRQVEKTVPPPVSRPHNRVFVTTMASRASLEDRRRMRDPATRTPAETDLLMDQVRRYEATLRQYEHADQAAGIRRSRETYRERAKITSFKRYWSL